MAGFSYQRIYEQTGVPEEEASKYVASHLNKLRNLEPTDIQQARTMQLARLDELLTAMWATAMKGSHHAMDQVLKILDRQAKLQGLDAPIRVDIEHRVRQLARESGLDEEEAVLAAMQLLEKQR